MASFVGRKSMRNLTLRFEEVTRVPLTTGNNLWSETARFIRENYFRHSIYIITDSNVEPLYSAQMEAALKPDLLFKETLVVPAGESSKNAKQFSLLLDELLRKKAGRDTVIIALGGGVIGDLAGFVAATLHRGVPLIQYPTSLLAQVDSSIGGKVGINHSSGKNLIGAFYQPAAVFSDVQCLTTLPEEEFFNGMAEVIKYAFILDKTLLSLLEQHSSALLQRKPDLLDKVIAAGIRLKAGVVEKDEKESGFRSVLNFGHTAGHALEKLSHYQLKHGFAVAAGMQIAIKLSHYLLNCPSEHMSRLSNILDTYHLKTDSISVNNLDALWNAMLSDKKSREGLPRFTLLRDLARPELSFPVSKENLKSVLAGN